MDGVFDGTNALSDANKGIIHSSFSSNSNWPYDWSSFVVDNTPTVASLLEIAAQGGSGATEKTVSSDETFDTDATEIFYFTSFTVESGQTLRATGTNPLVIVADTIDVHGTIDVSGANGQNASDIPRRFEEVSADDLVWTASNYLVPENRTIIRLEAGVSP